MAYDGVKLMGEQSFTKTVLELWLSREVSESEITLTEAMWVATIDHEGSPSSVAAQEALKQGKSLSDAVAAGVTTIGDQHGGAIAPLVKILQEEEEKPAATIVAEYLEKDLRLPGFGHRIYKDEDPRAIKLLDLAKEVGFAGKYADKVLEMEAELLKQKGIKLVLNIDGAMAAVLAEMGVPWQKTNAWFILPRVAGMLGRGVRD